MCSQQDFFNVNVPSIGEAALVKHAEDVLPTIRPARRLTDLTTGTIYSGLDLWFSDQESAEGTYGPISAWNTVAVTSLDYLFCGISGYIGLDNLFCGQLVGNELGATGWLVVGL
jgi:hypothetical protein